jgi:D-alanyl-lipoteichoic acid acyltransferase DltB (MBOAT superfamily)
MNIVQVLLLVALAILIGLMRRGRGLVLLGVSALAVYLLQPPSQLFPSQSFWLPTLTLFITVLTWAVTAPPDARSLRANWPALVTLGGAILVAFALDYLPLAWASSLVSPSPVFLAGALALFFVILAVTVSLRRGALLLLWLSAIFLLVIFVFLKSPWLTWQVFDAISFLRGREFDSSVTLNIAWLGYSYVAFRLLHTIRDRQSGVLPAVDLTDYVNYVIFFPSFTAGPIDRIERFLADWRARQSLTNDDWVYAGQRLAVGLFKKFVLADWLAWQSLNDNLVQQVHSGGWLWLFLYAYTFRLYFDFSGYTDIAIAAARLMGVRLPENFDAPFIKSNLTQFWNSWHMTLTQWFRSYFFNPFTRFLRTGKRTLPIWLIILLTQLVTMALIGLWHGVAWNFILWGLWHGVGLFAQNRWSEFMRARFPNFGASPLARKLLTGGGVFLTFNYFALSLVFFALSTPQLSAAAFMKLFGMS